jgi:hypothetical protein
VADRGLGGRRTDQVPGISLPRTPVKQKVNRQALARPAYATHNGARVRDNAAGGGTDEDERMQQATRTRALRCPCGSRMLAGDDEALHVMFREHIEREHPYADTPPEE